MDLKTISKLTTSEIKKLIVELQKQIAVLTSQVNAETNNRLRLYNAAVKSLGTDASPNDLAPDEVGCAETVNAVFKSVFGKEIGGGLSTALLFKVLKDDKRFMKVDQALPGDIVISPTGYGNGGLSNGHVGIVAEDENIMSNSSATGTFETNYTLKRWVARYRNKGGYPIYFFRVI